MSVQFLDLGRLHESIRGELDDAIDGVIRGSSFVGSTAVARFEESFAAVHGAAGGASCGSGTDALALSLRALGIGPGDEVIVPSMTFVATAEAVAHVGATPVVVDVHPQSLLLDPEAVDQAATDRTRGVVAVHLYGHVVPFPHLASWRERGWVVVEDAAQAHLAHWQGRPVGSVGHAACFSFYPGKNLGALGDGGIVISQDASLLDEVRALRDHGRTSKYVHDRLGWCSRLDGLQAAVLEVKLGHLPSWSERRRTVAHTYRERVLAAGISCAQLIDWEEGAAHHLLVARSEQRDALAAHLTREAIDTGIHYPVPLSRQPWLAGTSAPCPSAERAASMIVSLPMDPLMSDEDIEEVVVALRGFSHPD